MAEDKSKKRVLIVDDDPLIVRLYQRLFELSEFDASSVSSGEEAKKILAKDKFDVCILDIKLGDADGLEIANYIRNNLNLKDLKLIIFSGFADRPEVIEKCKDLGVVCILKGKEPPSELVIKAIKLLNEI